jgi:indole-3-glycerol phosphate synthase
MNSILNAIAADKRKHIREQKIRVSEQALIRRCELRDTTPDFVDALAEKILGRQTAIIAEIKKASPSKGLIRRDFEPASIARSYEQAGATCLSVLTDTPYFQGSDHDLETVRQQVRLPILRKDFILDPYQVLEAKALGADAILIILALVDDVLASDLCAAAGELDMAVLPEVHDRIELERALTLGTRLIGINNRDLHSFETRLSTTLSLLPYVPENRLVITESGIHDRSDIEMMQEAGVYGFLVGESLMRQPDPGEALSNLIS